MKVILKAFNCMMGEFDVPDPRQPHVWLPLMPRLTTSSQLMETFSETGVKKARFDNMGDGTFELITVE
jgi:hypothetical protein